MGIAAQRKGGRQPDEEQELDGSSSGNSWLDEVDEESEDEFSNDDGVSWVEATSDDSGSGGRSGQQDDDEFDLDDNDGFLNNDDPDDYGDDQFI